MPAADGAALYAQGYSPRSPGGAIPAATSSASPRSSGEKGGVPGMARRKLSDTVSKEKLEGIPTSSLAESIAKPKKSPSMSLFTSKSKKEEKKKVLQ